MASVPITVLLYDGLLLCNFNVVIKGLKCTSKLNLFRIETKRNNIRQHPEAILQCIKCAIKSTLASHQKDDSWHSVTTLHWSFNHLDHKCDVNQLFNYTATQALTLLDSFSDISCKILQQTAHLSCRLNPVTAAVRRKFNHHITMLKKWYVNSLAKWYGFWPNLDQKLGAWSHNHYQSVLTETETKQWKYGLRLSQDETASWEFQSLVPS